MKFRIDSNYGTDNFCGSKIYQNHTDISKVSRILKDKENITVWETNINYG